MKHTTATVAVLPDCDVCKATGAKVPAAFDAKTSLGPWAFLCPDHFVEVGIGLGLGLGQALEVAP